MDTDSDSSDTDVEFQEVLAKRPATTFTRRKLVPIKNGEDSQTESIYMSKLKKTMAAMHSAEPSLAVADNSDVEEETDIFSLKKKPGRERTCKRQNKKKQNDVIDLASDTENDPAASGSFEEQNDSLRERSPTPPPELGRLPKRARRTKALKNAVSALEDLNFRQRMREAVDRVYHKEDDDVVIIDEMASPSPVKFMAVKVRSLSGLYRFSLNKAESFSKILEKLAESEGVAVDRCVLFKDDKTIEPYDSPDSIKLHIADILELHIRKEGEVYTLDLDDPEIIELSIQTKDPRSKLVLPIHKNMRIEKIMRDFAKERNLDFAKLTFYFDGEKIQESQTPATLDMESDDCIDVVVS